MAFGPPPIARWVWVTVALACIAAAYLALKG
jgi:hypothetical protein